MPPGAQAQRHTISTFKFRRLFRATGRISGTVGMGADTRKHAALYDKIFIADRLACKITFKDLAHASGIARLRGERRSGDMRRHAVVRHRPPRMVFRSWLRKP